MDVQHDPQSVDLQCCTQERHSLRKGGALWHSRKLTGIPSAVPPACRLSDMSCAQIVWRCTTLKNQ
eukprot:8686892-Prorocentrum_lima.AAC.1